jgi:hypothetical protein
VLGGAGIVFVGGGADVGGGGVDVGGGGALVGGGGLVCAIAHETANRSGRPRSIDR